MANRTPRRARSGGNRIRIPPSWCARFGLARRSRAIRSLPLPIAQSHRTMT